jgi:hypothetical protein
MIGLENGKTTKILGRVPFVGEKKAVFSRNLCGETEC